MTPRDLLASLPTTGIPFPRNLKNALDGPPPPRDNPSSTGGVEGGRSSRLVSSSLSISLSEQREGVGAEVIDGVWRCLECTDFLEAVLETEAVVFVWNCFTERIGREMKEGIETPAGRVRDDAEPDAKLDSADEIPEWRFEGPPMAETS